jgi:hypothetical protein
MVITRVLALSLVAAVLIAPAGFARASSPQGEVRAALLHQARLFKKQRWRALYTQTTTARLRAACPYARFVRAQRLNYAILGRNFQLRGIRVRVLAPTRAIVAYTFARNGASIVRVSLRDRDLYVKVGRRWLDETDRVSDC